MAGACSGFDAQQGEEKIGMTKHRNVAKKLFMEGGWVQKRFFDIGWSDESKCRACHEEEGTEKHRLFHCLVWHEIRRGIPVAFRKWGQKARTSKKEWKWRRGIVEQLLNERQRKRDHYRMEKWESEKHKSWCTPPEGHVATDDSLLGTAGKWRACGWSVVQLDYGEELELLHGMYGSMEAELEVQRTIKRAELTAFPCLLKQVIGPTKV